MGQLGKREGRSLIRSTGKICKGPLSKAPVVHSVMSVRVYETRGHTDLRRRC